MQSFLRLPARGSEDNITYVIYMHIKSFAGAWVCREILCEEGEGGGVGEGELGGSALRFTENSQQLVEVCACTWPAGRSSQLFSGAFGGRERRQESWGGVGGGLPCSDKMGFSVLCELALRWQLWALMSLCAKTRAVRLFGHFPFFLKKNLGGVRGRVGGEKGFICLVVTEMERLPSRCG